MEFIFIYSGMRPPLKVLILIFLFFSTLIVQAQDFLVLEKMGTKKRYEYFAGDVIIFKLKSDSFFQKDEIIGLGDTSIVFSSGPVSLRSFEKISLSNKKKPLKGIGVSLVTAGLGYMIIDLFNKTISDGEVYFDEKVARTAGIIAGTGFAMIAIANKKVSLKHNWRLRIVDI